MDGLECKRCQEPDTFEVLCNDCEATVFGRTDRLIARSKRAKEKAEIVCDKLGAEALRALTGLDDEVTDLELFSAFNRQEFDGSTSSDKFFLCLQLLKLEDECEGYAELAEMSCRVPGDDNYLKGQIVGMGSKAVRQDWKHQ